MNSLPIIEPTYRIGELAKATDKSVRALRLYEEIGLLVPSTRSESNYRLYGEASIERVKWIGMLNDMGLSLNEIKAFVGEAKDEGVPRDFIEKSQALFEDKLSDLSQQIRKLKSLEKKVKRALDYTRSCTSCDVEDSGASSCKVCDENEIKAPALVRELTITCAEQREHRGAEQRETL